MIQFKCNDVVTLGYYYSTISYTW